MVSVGRDTGVVRRHAGAWLQTYTGRQFWPLEPDAGDVVIEDIAHALSMLCRFSGHCSRFYSVAEHSVLVASRTGVHGLLHDAAEAYLLDIVSPLKHLMPWYEEAEKNLLRVIYKGLDVREPKPHEVQDVKDADHRTLMTERAVLFDKLIPWEVDEPPCTNMSIRCLIPSDAEQLFIDTWEELRARISKDT